MLYVDNNSEIRDLFREVEGVSQHGLDELFDQDVIDGNRSFADAVIQAGIIQREELLSLISQYLGYELQVGEVGEIDQEVLSVIPHETARQYGVVPLYLSDGGVHLLALDPFNSSIIDDLTFALNLEISIVVCDPVQVSALLDHYYRQEQTSMDDLFGDVGLDQFENLDDAKEGDLVDAANETPIIRFVNLVIQQAIRAKASDIHFEPFEDEFRIRYRVDGALYEMSPPPKSLALPVISRVKVISELNIAEHRIPQDGRIKMTIEGRAVDLRVSTLPTQFGESVVLRVLDKSAVNLDLDNLGLPENVKSGIRGAVRRPNGIFIVTGPTGSGKTTTLYSALREVNEIDTKILTAEDPVEYEIEGIMQVPVNHQVGLDFARALRAFLRQDPDKIMVGEIRDIETARIAVQASLTGHVVLSTLHTNDAPGAITRLVDMGLEPFLLSASLEFILAQRLVRKICSSCKQEFDPKNEMIQNLGLSRNDLGDRKFYFGSGCEACSNGGYRGRTGLFEMIKVGDTFRELINSGAATLVLKQKAIEQGMRTLREDGLRSIFDGETTVEEVLKYT
ncbi:MAG: type II/IV secretion system protein [Opitutae bacterium]|jgi:type IV pilus assembly protein PilB|nr:GspE/PulE family protein [Verrucomicrobiota bacterium]MDA0905942.1 GspE/PulE family protein [Verrucomicrobiota bacterium]NDG99687.1 type II/IV secretion system protein [Opitutae bacterium]NDH15929.1 type II/IV secretion system protein [Opitutae bacterium]